MAAHTREQREFIVWRLARLETVEEIILGFIQRWPDTICSIGDVRTNDPARGALLPPELNALFLAERERILIDPTAAPMADKRARLIALQRMHDRARDNNQTSLAAELLAQIATETDGLPAGGAPGGTDAGKVKSITFEIVDPKPAIEATAS